MDGRAQAMSQTLQPYGSSVNKASRAARDPPSAKNTSISTIALPLCLVGENSA